MNSIAQTGDAAEDTAVAGQPETITKSGESLTLYGLKGEWQHFVDWIRKNARPSNFYPYGSAGAIRVEGLEGNLPPEQHYPLIELYHTLVVADGLKILNRIAVIEFWIELGASPRGEFDVRAVCKEMAVKPHFDSLLSLIQRAWKPLRIEEIRPPRIIQHNLEWGEPKRFRSLPEQEQETAVNGQTDQVSKVPKRPADKRKWIAMYQRIREYAERGWNAADIEKEIALAPEDYKNLPSDEKTIREIIKAGLAGELENAP